MNYQDFLAYKTGLEVSGDQKNLNAVRKMEIHLLNGFDNLRRNFRWVDAVSFPLSEISYFSLSEWDLYPLPKNHQVTVERGFFVCDFLFSGPCYAEIYPDSPSRIETCLLCYPSRDKEEAEEICRDLTKFDRDQSLIPVSGWKYALPSEEEWLASYRSSAGYYYLYDCHPEWTRSSINSNLPIVWGAFEPYARVVNERPRGIYRRSCPVSRFPKKFDKNTGKELSFCYFRTVLVQEDES